MNNSRPRPTQRGRQIATAPGILLLCGVLVTSVPTCGSAADPEVAAAEQHRVEVMERVAPSVVAVFAKSGQGGGSGVLISPDGYALSNFHVTSGAGDLMKCGLNDGNVYDAVIVGIDPTGDVALIQLLGRDDFPAATMGDSDAVRVGDWVFAMGNPFLLATDFHPTVTYGIVSGVQRYQYPAGTFLEYADCIQTDASINPGNSGGPLFAANGNLIGINGRGSFEKRGRVNSGAGYAISINQIQRFLPHLRGGRVVDHASLGATVETSSDGRVLVDSISERSQAYQRGLRTDDEILSFGGRPIRSVNQFKNILGTYPEGWPLLLKYQRGDERGEFQVRLDALHTAAELAEVQQEGAVPQPPHPGETEPPAEVNEELAQLFDPQPGFANYHFNRKQQERLTAAMAGLGNFESLAKGWRLRGTAADKKLFVMTLTDNGLGLELGETPYFQSVTETPLLEEPAGTGGLLVGMHFLRRLLTVREQAFSEYFYFGREPLDAGGPPVDVLRTERNGAVGRWYFLESNGLLVGCDIHLTPDASPCELRFREYGTFGAVRLPSKIEVNHEGKTVMTLTVEEAKLSPGSAADAG